MSDELRTALWIASFLAFWATTITIGMRSHLMIQAMITEVNPYLDESARFSGWWYYSKYQRLFSEYRRLYPTGERIGTLHTLWRVQVLLMTSVVWLMGFGLGVALFFAVGGILIGWINFSRNSAIIASAESRPPDERAFISSPSTHASSASAARSF